MANLAKEKPKPETEQPLPAEGQSAGTDLLDRITENYLNSRIQRQHIMNYNGANLAYNHQRNVAASLGLDPTPITPFPAPTSQSLRIDNRGRQDSAGLLGKLAIGAALLGMGGGIGAAASQFLPIGGAVQTGTDSSVGFTVE
jgi:hypothetical protein